MMITCMYVCTECPGPAEMSAMLGGILDLGRAVKFCDGRTAWIATASAIALQRVYIHVRFRVSAEPHQPVVME